MAPRKPTKPAIPSDILIIDNGAYNIKAGWAPPSSALFTLSSQIDLSQCHLIPNCLAKQPSSKHTLVGAQLSQCRDFAEMAFRRPVQRGQLVNWESEREIWCTSFFDTDGGGAGAGAGAGPSAGLVVPCPNPQDTSLILTEAPNSFAQLQSNADQVVFEEFEFGAYRRVPAPVLSAYADLAGVFGDRKDGPMPDDKMDTEAPEEVEGTDAAAPATTASEKADSTAARPPPVLGHNLATSECVLVIDSGYSHTTVTPVWRGRPVQQAVRRLDVGGKLLTNHLKETLSVRQLDLTHETYIVNQMKEDVCFVTADLRRDLDRTWKQSPRYEPKVKQMEQQAARERVTAGRDGDGQGVGMDVDMDTDVTHASSEHATDTTTPANAPTNTPDPYAQGIVLDYVLPDYTSRFRGSVRAHDALAHRQAAKARRLGAGAAQQDTILTLGNERFMTPEILFSPADVLGLQQAGLAEVVMQSVRALPPGLWAAMLGNVLVVGGNARLPGFAKRLEAELRPLVPVEVPLRIRLADRDPEKAAWEGAARLAARVREDKNLMRQMFVTRAEYLEHGEGWVMRQFDGERPLPW